MQKHVEEQPRNPIQGTKAIDTLSKLFPSPNPYTIPLIITLVTPQIHNKHILIHKIDQINTSNNTTYAQNGI